MYCCQIYNLPRSIEAQIEFLRFAAVQARTLIDDNCPEIARNKKKNFDWQIESWGRKEKSVSLCVCVCAVCGQDKVRVDKAPGFCCRFENYVPTR